MKRGMSGRYEISRYGNEEVRSFIPDPLPPHPWLDMNGHRQLLTEQATLALGRLDSITDLLPYPNLFLYPYIRREAVVSSQIEGTQSSLSDLLLFELNELPGVPFDDVVEVSNYIAALKHGITRLQEGFPLSSRLVRDVHGVLLSRGRGSEKQPGQYRTSQNWIGGTRPGNAHYVPPGPLHVVDCMSQLELYLNSEQPDYPVLIRAALAHAQFETIHPFLDGNGRVGRLLIVLILYHFKVLQQPLLYLSLFFKEHRSEYYRLLDLVRQEGEWELWIEFFLEGVRDTASGAVDTARRLVAIFSEDSLVVSQAGRMSSTAAKVLGAFREKPLSSIQRISDNLEITYPTAAKGVELLVKLELVSEITGQQRNRVYAYTNYLAILSEGTNLQ